MAVWDGLRRWFGASRSARGEGTEQDVGVDRGVASSRATGGEHTELTGDRGSVTGTGRTGDFVGRIAGDDVGYAGETGAERRAQASGEESTPERR